MSAPKVKRPRTFNSALAAWPDAMQKLAAHPCDDTLSSLCTLLDVMDGEIVRTWQTGGHDDRLAIFRECRAAARQANRLVTATTLGAAKERGQKAWAARLAKKAAA